MYYLKLGCSFLLLGLCTSCLWGAPAEAYGPVMVLGVCGTSQGNFATQSACKIFDAAKATKMVNDIAGYTILLPTEAEISAYLNKNNISLEQFINSQNLIPFVKNHVFLGKIASGMVSRNLAGNIYSIEKVNNKLMILSAELNLLYSFEEASFFNIDKIIE
jgi:hypothetical protein